MRVIQNPNKEFYREVLAKALNAHFFHTPEYMDLCVQALPNLSNQSLGFVFDDGKKAFFPLLQSRKKFGLAYGFMSSYRGYGGLVAEQQLSASHHQEAFEAVSFQCLKKRIYNFDLSTPPGYPVVYKNPFRFRTIRWTANPAQTYQIQLSRNPQEVIENYSKHRKSDIKRALEAGVCVRLAEDEEDAHAFYQIYQDRVLRWGEEAKANFSLHFFQSVFSAMRQSCGIKLWLATDKNTVRAGAIALYSSKIVNYWINASYKDDGNHANTFLISKIIEDACERGYAVFDMGRSQKHGGILFKKQYGAVETPYQIYSCSSPLTQKLVRAVTKISSWFGR